MDNLEGHNRENYHKCALSKHAIQMTMSDNVKKRADNKFAISTDEVGKKGEFGKIIKNTLDEFIDKIAIMRKVFYAELASTKVNAASNNSNLELKINGVDTRLKQDLERVKKNLDVAINKIYSTFANDFDKLRKKLLSIKNDLEDEIDKNKDYCEKDRNDFFARLDDSENMLKHELRSIKNNIDKKIVLLDKKMTSVENTVTSLKSIDEKLYNAKCELKTIITKIEKQLLPMEGLDTKVVVVENALKSLQGFDIKINQKLTEIQNKVKPIDEFKKIINDIESKLESRIERKIGKNLEGKININNININILSEYIQNKFGIKFELSKWS